MSRLLPALLVLSLGTPPFVHAASPRVPGDPDWAQVREEAAQLLSKYVSVPSVTGAEGPAAAVLEQAALSRGLTVEHMDTAEKRPNLFITTGARVPPKVIMLTHIDVVPAPDDGWSYPPFSGARMDGSIWGRGSLDNKGMAIMHLMALAQLKRSHPEVADQVAMLSVSDEEDGGDGASWVVSHYAHRLGKAPVMGEGGTGLYDVDPVPKGFTMYPIATAEKSALWLKLSLTIPASGHGSVPPEEYASRAMVMALQRLLKGKLPMRIVPQTRQLLETLARYQDFPKNFFLLHPTWPVLRVLLERFLSANPLTNALIRDTITLTGVTTETSIPNAIPLRIVALLDCRLLPGTPEADFIKTVAGLLNDARIQISVLHGTPNSVGTEAGPLMAAMKGALEAEDAKAIVTPFLFPATSDGSTFRAAGHAFYGLLPCKLSLAEIEGIHGRDERIREESLESGVRITLRTLQRFLGIIKGE